MKIDGTLEKAMQRLAQFEEWTGTKCPYSITEGKGKDRTFAHDFLVYANANNLSLDWVWLGDVRGLVLGYHRQAKPTETPVMALFNEWKRLFDYSQIKALTDDEHNAAVDAFCAVELQMETTPSITPQDFIAKVIAGSSYGDFGLTSNKAFWAEAKRFVGGAA